MRSYLYLKIRKKKQSLLGLYNYCAKFVKDSHKIVSPLYRIIRLKSNEEISFWKSAETNREYLKAIENLKMSIKNSTCLTIPNTKDMFILTTDASGEGCGAVLAQVIEGKEKIIGFYSSLHSSAEKNYSTAEQELLAVIKAFEHFRDYLLLRRVVLKTDHQALKYLFKSRNIKARPARWSLLLQEFDFEIQHIPGESNYVDHLSRDFKSIDCSVDNVELRNDVDIG